MAALKTQMLDVSTGSFRDPQAVQREQRDQRMHRRRAEPGRHQQGTELVAVQRDRMGLVIDPRTADMRGRGPAQELFFDGVPVAPGPSWAILVRKSVVAVDGSEGLLKVAGERVGGGDRLPSGLDLERYGISSPGARSNSFLHSSTTPSSWHSSRQEGSPG